MNNTDLSINTESEINDVVSKVREELTNSPEVQKLSREIDIKDKNSLIEYGANTANAIGDFADRILDNVKKSELDDSAVMLKQLAKLMKSFNPQDFDDDNRNFVSKLFVSSKKIIEKILSKYQSIGGEIEHIYIEVKKYSNQLNQTNTILEDLYQQNFSYYETLEKYIIAANITLNNLMDKELPQLETNATNGEQVDIIKLEDFKGGVKILEQRIYDLEMAKAVSLQTAPQIRIIQNGNYKLLQKIQSAFVITIPIFKNGIVQAVALKKQKIVADSMDALDTATNELLLRNAQNTAQQGAQIARLSSSSIKIETLQETWQTILKGIEDTKIIEEENKKSRLEGINKLNSLQNDIFDKMRK